MIDEPLDLLMDTIGEDLVFQTFSIKGFPTFDFDTFFNETYKVETQDVRFKILHEMLIDKNIQIGNSFTMTVRGIMFSFKVSSVSTYDFTGLAEIKVEYLGRTRV